MYFALGLVLAYGVACFLLARSYVGHRNVGAPLEGTQFALAEVPGRGYDIPAYVSNELTTGEFYGDTVVVFVHGLGGSPASWSDLAPIVANSKVGVVVPWMAGHGQSKRDQVGFGPAEAAEILACVRWARKAGKGQRIEVIIVGVSLGASSAWLATGLADPGEISAVVAEDPFPNLNDAIDRWFEVTAGNASKLLGPVRMISTRMTGFDPSTVYPVVDAGQWQGNPGLLIRNENDRLFPASYIEAYEKSTGLDVWVIPDSGHAQGAKNATKEYARRIADLVSQVRTARE